MAAARATPFVKHVDKVQLRVMVIKEMNKVVYAEAGKDFVDVLLSFLTLPLGTIAKLVAKESNIEAVKLGSLSSLYQSVAALDEQYLSTPTCKEMLLNPRNSMADYCRPLKLNIDDTEPIKYFRCEKWRCNRREIPGPPLSTFWNQKCSCGEVLNTEVFPECLDVDNGFVEETATFIISDDLHVLPNVFGTTIRLLQKLGVDNNDTIREQTVDITKQEVIDLLKLSLLSKTCLTDFIFKKQLLVNSSPRIQSEFGIGNVESSVDGMQMDLKVMVRKSNGQIVFVEAEEDFADILFSFLTFPLGGVLHMLEGFTSLGCLYNLYESMKELSPERYLISQDLKDTLTKPKIAPQYDLNNQILPISATPLPVYYCQTYYHKYKHVLCIILTRDKMLPESSSFQAPMCIQFSLVDPKSSSKSSRSGKFAKGPSTYMVTDDLVISPMSSASAMSYLNRSKVPLLDLEEKVIKIGIKESLAILKASLISATALTDGLSQFIITNNDSAKRRRTIKKEK